MGFLGWVDRYDIPFHERSHGQLFCNDSAKDILNMLLSECEKTQVEIRLNCNVQGIKQLADNQFQINTDKQSFQCQSLVIATGGLSIPKMGASAFGYQVAEQFGIPVIPVRAALVPFTLQTAEKQKYSALSGVAVAAEVICKNQSFKENVLFTHRGLSGPVMLQISSYWQAGEAIAVNFLPDLDVVELLQQKRADNVKHQIKNSLAEYLPKRLVEALLDQKYWAISMQDISNQQIDDIARAIQYWQIKPNGTEGYRTAEVTLGGVDCSSISSKTMQSNEITGLYFIGEVLDVTGWLGGYNFQWAWSSGWCAGQYV